MRIIPVIDLMDGTVVRGVAGRRDEYRPVRSRLAADADPCCVARGVRDHLGLNDLYVADLDGILYGRANLSIYETLAADGFRLMVDAGFQDVGLAKDVADLGVDRVVAGLETSSGPDQLQELCDELEPGRVVFSLDLKDGKPLGNPAPWGSTDPFEIGRRAMVAGVTQIIVLDLAQVGIAAGVGTLELCRRFRNRFDHLEVVTGGGVRSGADLMELKNAGISGVLIASALHNGAIGHREINALKD